MSDKNVRLNDIRLMEFMLANKKQVNVKDIDLAADWACCRTTTRINMIRTFIHTIWIGN